jgi:predicted nucleotidyltransferase
VRFQLDRATEPVLEKIITLTAPDKIYIFGSRVKVSPPPDSDLDLLIVVSDPVGDPRQRQHDLQEALASLRPAVHAWIMGRLRFEEEKNVVGGLAYPATHEGVLVYEKT